MRAHKIIYAFIFCVYAINVFATKEAPRSTSSHRNTRLAPTQIMPETQSEVNDAVQVENQANSGAEGGHGK